MLKMLAIICVTGLEVYAISQGIDGVLLTAVVALIAGLAGYEIARKGLIK